MHLMLLCILLTVWSIRRLCHRQKRDDDGVDVDIGVDEDSLLHPESDDMICERVIFLQTESFDYHPLASTEVRMSYEHVIIS